MAVWQYLLFAIILVNLWGTGIAIRQLKSNTFGGVGILNLFGSFVWGDVIIFSPFWIVASLLALIRHDLLLFLLLSSLFWLVRSLGETIYWLNEQFSTKKRNPPETLRFSHFFQGDAIWFVYQIYWQVVTVFSLLSVIVLTRLWFRTW